MSAVSLAALLVLGAVIFGGLASWGVASGSPLDDPAPGIAMAVGFTASLICLFILFCLIACVDMAASRWDASRAEVATSSIGELADASLRIEVVRSGTVSLDSDGTIAVEGAGYSSVFANGNVRRAAIYIPSCDGLDAMRSAVPVARACEELEVDFVCAPRNGSFARQFGALTEISPGSIIAVSPTNVAVVFRYDEYRDAAAYAIGAASRDAVEEAVIEDRWE